MKNSFTKFCITVAGILSGLIFTTGFAGAQITQDGPGKPNVYSPSGQTVTTRSTGKFGSLQEVGASIIDFIQKTIIPLIMTLALLVFLWGILHYIKNGGDSSEREQGRQFMLWGIIGLAVMVSVWGLVRILTNTLGQPLGAPTSVPTIPSR